MNPIIDSLIAVLQIAAAAAGFFFVLGLLEGCFRTGCRRHRGISRYDD